ncbi:YhgE/Pip domain-containing protein [uncultured Enorma sp.]|uniref:YhgE/Pip domain-containing protein n=1 Tax=uncultured Enorma sp. TaxID=1714346 RepID=UPI0025FB10D1|nr:YhgE/Pip domain-containing protein [uncultured Enorma sp.]
MKHILALLRRDGRRAYANAITIVVMAGIIAVPSFYAWFNIAGSWDPYANTRDLKVAVANTDAGYDGELVPVHVNLGERVVAELLQSESIGYVPASKDEALEGVRAGTYYAAVIIPEDYSACLMSAFSASPRRAQIVFVQNEKANAIAEIVTDKAGTAVERDIETSFVAATTDVGTAAATELASSLDDGDLATIATRLEAALGDAARELRAAAENARAYAELTASTQALLAGSTETFDAATDPLQDAGDALTNTADGMEDVSGALDEATTSVDDALANAHEHLGSVSAAVDDAFEDAGQQASDLADGLSNVKAAVDDQASQLSDLAESLSAQIAAAQRLEKLLPENSPSRAAVHTAIAALTGIEDRLNDLQSELTELSSALEATARDIAQGTANVQTAREKLDNLIADAQAGIDAARDAYEDGASEALAGLEDGARDAAATIATLQGDVAATLAAVDDATSTTAGGLDASADSLDALQERLHAALASSDLEQVRAILAASPASLASFMARPVRVERTAVFPVENNGSAMTPFYTTLSIWIGGVVLAALVRVRPSERALRETGCTATEAYLGRLALFAGTGLLQTTLICAGNILYLEVQCAHPVLFLLAGWVASFVFVNIIYALTASFGDVGKAIAVVLMVLQVAGSGGTFPQQMLPAGFQLIYSWLPFVHAENAMRAAMFGIWNADFWIELGLLAAYLVPALLLGLVLRRPVMRLTAWMEDELEATQVM